MRKFRLYLLPIIATLCLFSCGQNKSDLLIGRWHSVKVVNRDKDNFFRSSKAFIDTMGNSNTPEVNAEVYGVANMDSLRRELRAQFDSAYAAQMNIDTQSIFTFKTDSAVLFSFPGKTEKGKWHLDDQDLLVLDETNELGQTEQIKLGVKFIDKNKLELTFVRDLDEGVTDTSIVTFRREKK
jgi:hypothetical protein